MPRLRRKFFVDAQVQGWLITRALLYWFCCLISIALMMSCWIAWHERPASSAELFRMTFTKATPAFLGSLLLLPVVVLDCLRLSNRFAGPMVRMRRAMKQLASGEQVAPVKLRQGDFWFDFAEDFNRVLQNTERTGESNSTA